MQLDDFLKKMDDPNYWLVFRWYCMLFNLKFLHDSICVTNLLNDLILALYTYMYEPSKLNHSKIFYPSMYVRRTVSRGSTDVVLTDEDIELIERIQSSQYPDQSHDPYAVSNKYTAYTHRLTCTLFSHLRIYTHTRR